MPNVTVQPGECLSTIARRAGFTDAKKIWELPQNAELRKKRKSFDVLHPGDVVFVPDKKEATFSIGTGQQHVFQVKGGRKKLHFIVRDGADKPVANAKYELRIGGLSIQGTTDDKGAVIQQIPMQAKSAELEFDDQLWNLNIGALNPVEHTPDDGTRGIQARLKNLGLLIDEQAGELCDRTKRAVADFKTWAGMEVDHVIDDVFVQKLEEAHKGELTPDHAQSSSNAKAEWKPIDWTAPDSEEEDATSSTDDADGSSAAVSALAVPAAPAQPLPPLKVEVRARSETT